MSQDVWIWCHPGNGRRVVSAGTRMRAQQVCSTVFRCRGGSGT